MPDDVCGKGGVRRPASASSSGEASHDGISTACGVHRGNEGGGLHDSGPADGAVPLRAARAHIQAASATTLSLLPSVDHGAVDAGLKYVNNDICYPSILVTGQIMEAVTSGRYDTDKLAVLITQTGGGCRATNYISLIRKALKAAGLGHIPVIALSFKDLGEVNPGFKITPTMLLQAVYALCYGDLLMMTLYRTRPYEIEPGAANHLFDALDGRMQGAAGARREALGIQAHREADRGRLRHAAAAGRGHQAARRRRGRDSGEVPPRRRTTKSST